MLKIILEGHDNYYGIADVVRAFWHHPSEDREGKCVVCEEAPDCVLVSGIGNGHTKCSSADGTISVELPAVTSPFAEGREVKRSVYLALSRLAGRNAPWGCLTGIRPTLVAGEEQDPALLEEKYFVRSDKAELAWETYQNEKRILSTVPRDDLNIYVGIPFCPSRCEYCSFISSDIHHHMGRLKSYLDALEGEISYCADRIMRSISTLYIGGGTPTVFDDDDFERLLDIIYGNIHITHMTEVTVEAGRPDTITERKLKAMHDRGIKRICINPQTMNSETLLKLNRKHTADDTVRMYELARRTGFEVINMDLIAGLKYEDADDHIESVRRLIELDPENITVHTLYKKRRAEISIKDVMGDGSDEVDNAVSRSHMLLKEAGYIPYYLYRQKDTGHGLENTGFAKPGTECRYNVAMMTDSRDVLSFGAGGMSKRVFEQTGEKFRVERCPCIKDVIGYIDSWKKMAQRKTDFFDIMCEDNIYGDNTK